MFLWVFQLRSTSVTLCRHSPWRSQKRLKSALRLCLRRALWFVSISNHITDGMLSQQILVTLIVWVSPIKIVSKTSILFILFICKQPCPTYSSHFQYTSCLCFLFQYWKKTTINYLAIFQSKKALGTYFLNFYYCLKFWLKSKITL